MATALPLPKRLHPDFIQPYRKPIGRVEIDWDNPLTQGLRMFVLFQGNVPYDLVTGRRLDISASTGTVDYSPANGEFALNVNSSAIAVNTEPTPEGITIFGRIKADQTTATERFLNLGNSASNEFASVFFHSGGKIRFQGTDNGGTIRYTVNSTDNYVADKYYSITAVSNIFSQNVVLYMDNDIVQSAAASFTAPTMDRFGFGGRYMNGSWANTGNGDISYAGYFVRDLTQAEAQALNADPYQILKPAKPVFYFIPAGGTTYNVSGSLALTTGFTGTEIATLVGAGALDTTTGFTGNGTFEGGAAGTMDTATGLSGSSTLAGIDGAGSLALTTGLSGNGTFETTQAGVLALTSGLTSTAVIEMSEGATLTLTTGFTGDSTVEAGVINVSGAFDVACGVAATAVGEFVGAGSLDVNADIVAQGVADMLAAGAMDLQPGMTSQGNFVIDAVGSFDVTMSLTGDGEIQAIIEIGRYNTYEVVFSPKTYIITFDAKTYTVK